MSTWFVNAKEQAKCQLWCSAQRDKSTNRYLSNWRKLSIRIRSAIDQQPTLEYRKANMPSSAYQTHMCSSSTCPFPWICHEYRVHAGSYRLNSQKMQSATMWPESTDQLEPATVTLAADSPVTCTHACSIIIKPLPVYPFPMRRHRTLCSIFLTCLVFLAVAVVSFWKMQLG